MGRQAWNNIINVLNEINSNFVDLIDVLFESSYLKIIYKILRSFN